ncbi:hypothetical protein BLNAU_13194 [Blattamonas nauphoetae]|uniref:C2H2-type domain-containing protein n=1 Tax=Blattamonas nauphoetae TaxID=2049346 RepID=A0ABQ9XIG5_9EUKA|nr:hypothetical protein BLNAU_13194 [Blattamonas nauphoetae]
MDNAINNVIIPRIEEIAGITIVTKTDDKDKTKEFVASLPANTSPEESIRRYESYKSAFRFNATTFFNAHKDDEWFKDLYHPTRLEELYLRKRSSITDKQASFLTQLESNEVTYAVKNCNPLEKYVDEAQTIPAPKHRDDHHKFYREFDTSISGSSIISKLKPRISMPSYCGNKISTGLFIPILPGDMTVKELESYFLQSTGFVRAIVSDVSVNIGLSTEDPFETTTRGWVLFDTEENAKAALANLPPEIKRRKRGRRERHEGKKVKQVEKEKDEDNESGDGETSSDTEEEGEGVIYTRSITKHRVPEPLLRIEEEAMLGEEAVRSHLRSALCICVLMDADKGVPSIIPQIFDGSSKWHEWLWFGEKETERSTVDPSLTEAEGTTLRSIRPVCKPEDFADLTNGDYLVTLERLDRIVTYLRAVHSFCFYCCYEFENEQDMSDRCGPVHGRAKKEESGRASEMEKDEAKQEENQGGDGEKEGEEQGDKEKDETAQSTTGEDLLLPQLESHTVAVKEKLCRSIISQYSRAWQLPSATSTTTPVDILSQHTLTSMQFIPDATLPPSPSLLFVDPRFGTLKMNRKAEDLFKTAVKKDEGGTHSMCMLCEKKFKAEVYVRNHIINKHSEHFKEKVVVPAIASQYSENHTNNPLFMFKDRNIDNRPRDNDRNIHRRRPEEGRARWEEPDKRMNLEDADKRKEPRKDIVNYRDLDNIPKQTESVVFDLPDFMNPSY